MILYLCHEDKENRKRRRQKITSVRITYLNYLDAKDLYGYKDECTKALYNRYAALNDICTNLHVEWGDDIETMKTEVGYIGRR